MELGTKYYRHSGTSLESCSFLAQRFDLDVGFVAGESECHIASSRLESGKLRLRTNLSTTGWLTGLWRSLAGDVFACSAEGKLYVGAGSTLFDAEEPFAKSQLDIVFQGVWGTSFNEVFAWGMDSGRPRIQAWNGSAWSEANAPGFIVEAMHGLERGPRLAAGRGGMVARADGSTWTEFQTPVPEILVSVFVAGPGEYYAGGNMGTILEGSDAGWGVIGRIPGALQGDVQAVGKWGSELWVAASRLGLWRRTGLTSGFELVDPGLFAVALDTRGDLLVGCEDSVTVSKDGQKFESRAVGSVEKALAGKPLAWFDQG